MRKPICRIVVAIAVLSSCETTPTGEGMDPPPTTPAGPTPVTPAPGLVTGALKLWQNCEVRFHMPFHGGATAPNELRLYGNESDRDNPQTPEKTISLFLDVNSFGPDELQQTNGSVYPSITHGPGGRIDTLGFQATVLSSSGTARSLLGAKVVLFTQAEYVVQHAYNVSAIRVERWGDGSPAYGPGAHDPDTGEALAQTDYWFFSNYHLSFDPKATWLTPQYNCP